MRRYFTKDGETYNSFLECISARDFTLADINKPAILQFLTFGALYFEDTLINGISKKFTHQNLTLNPLTGFENKYKPAHLIEKPLSKPNDRFFKYFINRTKHLKNKHITVDLTGGIDSRLIVAILDFNDVNFDTVFSRNSGNEYEEAIVKRVAKQLNVNLHIIESNNEFDESYVKELFDLGDAHWDVLALNSLGKTQRWREEQGYNLAITGIGGELYKDFWWQQDFPFYNKKKVKLQRLVDTRMYPVIFDPEWLGNTFKEAQANTISNLSRRLIDFKGSNTQVYDQIYYHIRIKEQVSVMTNASANYLDVWSPLLEEELLDIGYNLPRSQRFFNRFHRKLITKINPALASIPTTEGGMSVSDKVDQLSKDIWKYGIDKSAKVGRRFKPSTSKSHKSLSSNSFLVEKTQTSIEILKEAEIFSKKAPKDAVNIPQQLWGRIITIAMLLQRLKN